MTTVTVVGAGAIGGWLAARLALSGQPVNLLARGQALARIRSQGLELRSGGQVQVAEVRACASADEIGPQDVVLVTLKAPALPGMAGALRQLMHADTVLASAANGLPWWYFLPPGLACQGLRLRSVDPHGVLEATLPMPQVLGLSVLAACSCPQPGVVQHNAGQRLVLGEPGGGLSPRVSALAQRLQAAGLDAQPSADMRRDIWLKLMGNACFNPASLITGAHTDDMIDEPGLHALFLQLMGEAMAVGGRLGLTLAVDPAQRIAQARQLGHIKTSMLQDLEAGRAVEIDAILGALAECAQAVALPVPMTAAVLALARVRARAAGLPA